MDLAQYAELFLAESREHLATVNDLLLAWEREPASREPIGGIFRAVHTIKGMAAMMGYDGVAALSHRLESLLEGLRHTAHSPDPPMVDLLFRSVDALDALVGAAVAGRTAVPDAALLAALDQAAIRSAAPASHVTPSRAERTEGSEPATGLPIHVTLVHDAPLKGPRALLVLARARELGVVAGVDPPLASLEQDEFNGAFSFRLATAYAPEEIVERLRAAGDVAEVVVGASGESRVEAAGPLRHVRVDLRRLDALVNLVGELVTARGQLATASGGLRRPELDEATGRIARLVGDLQNEIVQARMTPIWQVFDRFPRLVRDLAHRLGKDIELVIEGKDIELDRALLDEIGDPLVHLLRNAVDHGIESPDQRRAAGKPSRGRVVLAAVRERETVAIRVSDDGKGIDRDQILREARAKGFVESGAESLSDEALIRVLARPGFSTVSAVSDVSGRGVGVEVIVTRARALGGAVELVTEAGVGSTFTLRLPTSLAIVRALIARVGEERYAVPLTHVAETVDLDPRYVTTLEGCDALTFHDRLIPLVHLRDVLGIEGEAPTRRPVIVVEVGQRCSGLVVDAMLGQQEIMVKPFSPPAGMLPVFSGATILGDGAPVLILDAGSLL
jgi:two-component system chemotaxis sensor kinase CheA